MPIIPSEPAHGAGLEQPHHARHVAESFGSDAARYDRSRPRYPDALIERIVSASPGRSVLDVGCGTGIVARQFRAAGCSVLGIDVDPRMAQFARDRGLDVEVEAFETWDAAGRTYDAIVCGQSWHWIDPVAGAAKAADTLRPGGRLAAFWNTDEPSAQLADAFAEVYRRVMPDALAARRWMASAQAAVQGGLRLCTTTADAIRGTGAFDEPEHWRFDWERSYTCSEWLDQVPTTGDHTQFPPRQLEELLVGIGGAIDAIGGSFTMRYATLVVTATRTRTA